MSEILSVQQEAVAAEALMLDLLPSDCLCCSNPVRNNRWVFLLYCNWPKANRHITSSTLKQNIQQLYTIVCQTNNVLHMPLTHPGSFQMNFINISKPLQMHTHVWVHTHTHTSACTLMHAHTHTQCSMHRPIQRRKLSPYLQEAGHSMVGIVTSTVVIFLPHVHQSKLLTVPTLQKPWATLYKMK